MKLTGIDQVSLIDLKRQQERIRPQIDRRIQQVLNHGQYILGPEIKELEEKLAQYAGRKHCVSCASGTDALLMPLLALDIRPGDAIFTPPFTFFATAEVILLLGARPVFVDIDSRTFNIDPKSLELAIDKIEKEKLYRPRGIITVDLFGQPANYTEIEAMAKSKDFFVIQDAAQSFGATYKGKKSCSQGDFSATSFFPAKPLGCYGDGGAIFCDNDDWAKKLRSIRVHGQGEFKYDNIRVGMNGRLDTIQAAILLSKLEIFDDEIQRRNDIAQKYSKELESAYVTPYVHKDNVSAWAQYSLLTHQREKVIKHLTESKIGHAIYYPKPLHLQKACEPLGYRTGDFPISEKISNEIFSIPMFPDLSLEEQNYVIEQLLNAQK